MERRIFKAFVPAANQHYWIIQEDGREYPFSTWEVAIQIATRGYALRRFLSLDAYAFIRVSP